MEDGRSIAYFAELGYNTDKPEPSRNKSARCSMLGRGSAAEGTVLPLGKNRRFGFKAESEPTRKEEFLCLLKIRSIS